MDVFPARLVVRSRPVGWAAFAVLLAIYALTLAPSVTWWDSGELIAAVHSLGIPHPPGTAAYVVVAKVWTLATWPLDFAVRVNLLSAVSTAVAIGMLGSMLARWTREPMAALAGAVCAGATSTVWRNANEAEVYALALLASVVILWSADRAGSDEGPGSWRWIVLLAYCIGLAYALHLAALVTVPAALALAWRAHGRLTVLRVASLAGVALLGVSLVLFLIVRASHDPSVNQGNPATWVALVEVLGREQYTNAGLWPRQAPLYLQIGNWFEYADWQFALGLHPSPPPSLARTSVTVFFVLLGLYGCVAHRALDRRSWRALGVLFASASIGIVLYLNLKAGPSFGEGFLPDGAPREARERDYFFAVSFAVWGLWAGLGSVLGFRSLARRIPDGTARTIFALVGMGIVTLPIALNWKAVDRRGSPDATAARDSAHALLDRAPRGGVLLAAGDNDTYPLWYAQEVEGRRTDVTVVTIPLLAAEWYRGEIARRHRLMTNPLPWRGLPPTLDEVCGHALSSGRAVALASRAIARTLPKACLQNPAP